MKVIESIIKDKDVNPYAEQTMKEFGASGLLDLARACFFLPFFLYSFMLNKLTMVLSYRRWSVCRLCRTEALPRKG